MPEVDTDGRAISLQGFLLLQG